MTKNQYSAIIKTEHKNRGAERLRLYPIPDSDNADGGSFSYCDYTPPQFVREFFVYMALLTGNCKDFVFMVDFKWEFPYPGRENKIKKENLKIMKRNKTRAMVECALMIALGTVLAQIKIWQMPYGGSVTLVSCLPFILVSYRHGVKWGLGAGIVNGCLQMMTGFWAPPAGTVTALVMCILLDYLLGFGVLGTASAFSKPFKNKKIGVAFGIAMAMAGRFLCSFLSGALLWGSYQSYYEWADGMSVWMYSFIYNGSYMLPEMIITVVASLLIISAYPDFFKEQ